MLKAIRDLGCDGIFTIAVVDQTDPKTHYVPGYFLRCIFARTAVMAIIIADTMLIVPAFYSPGYYSTDKTYFHRKQLIQCQYRKDADLHAIQSGKSAGYCQSK